MINVKFNKTEKDAIIPTQVAGSAGLDFYACIDEEYMVLPSHETKMVPTGIRTILPDGYFMLLEERGSTGSKGIKRSAGVIDNSFRGEIFVALTNANDYDICLYKPDKKSIAAMYEKMLKEAEVDDEEFAEATADKCKIVDSWFQNLVKDRFDTANTAVVDTYEIKFYPVTKAIAQGIVLPQYEIISEEIGADEYEKNTTARGNGMLGSSGK